MLPNTGKLSGCTLFITGASRGIGKAIALKAAKDGANIVIAAKTSEPHPKLAGTIYTAAEEIEAAGGKALPCVVNVREEEQIADAVEKAVQKFGGIDILVNNASAISLTGTLETTAKKLDLMMSANTRGTYLTSKLCLPFLKNSKIAHILNISPPLNLNPIWFKNHCAYTISKYGMSMCVLGMAEEFRGEVAVNALWPKTAIYTAAMDMLGGPGVEKQCRKTDIVADAAYCILTKPKSFTGNFVIDEHLLKKEGIKNFDVYAVAPGHPVIPDYFLDEDLDTQAMKMEAQGASSGFREEKKADGAKHTGPEGSQISLETSTAKPSGSVAETFKIIEGIINEDVVKSTQGVFLFELSGEEGGTWYIDLKNKGGNTGSGEPPVKADVIMSMSSNDFVKMFTGKLKPTMAFMSGKLRIKGNMSLALRLEKLVSQLGSKL
ncbi:hydroxysteroid dehydrogenase-like protein 2 [Alligator mississippiensis]|uniref:Hydroxysteroid dehydrogenase-like protein 2 n=1 Tax=Alligator mississippiensis TaxID=8496 RepID=A0A151NEA8_ALLMI|nr:hydroxysteroid dehydrogenase-like protein 2 [Alligator mississippiensis]KYO35146.1 hydroxysteroid dehydrogenase-like protein 2 [Alligator mississippiensis]